MAFLVRVRCIPMVESSSDLPCIPENIRSAFREAVGLFAIGGVLPRSLS